MPSHSLKDIVDVSLYPLTDRHAPEYKALVKRLRDELSEYGMALLPKFMTHQAIQQTLQSVQQSSFTPYRTLTTHNVYQEDIDDEEVYEETHAKRVNVRSCMETYAYDQVDPDSPLNTLFISDEMTEFVRDVLRKEQLYRTADPLGALTVNKYIEGDELGWHFDRGDFAVTLLLQEPESGGEFEFYPSLRDDQNPNYDKTKHILQLSQEGQDLQQHGVKVAPFGPGTLSIFCGRNSMHRVTPVKGSKPRYLAVLSYEQKPNVYLNDYTNLRFFGRVS